MLLQPISFPKGKTAEALEGLYYRKISGESRLENGVLVLEAGAVVRLDTRFGCFSPKQWKQYTHISSLGIALRLQGAVNVRLFHEMADDKGKPYVRRLEEKNVSVKPDRCYFGFGELLGKGIYYCEIEALAGGVRITDGGYEDEGKHYARDVKIALCICSFKTGAVVSKRAAEIRKELIENQKSPCYHRLAVLVADNSRTMKRGELPPDEKSFMLFSNKNTGGVGGFTRCIIEAQAVGGFTHCLLSDDDASAPAYAYERLVCFLRALKAEHTEMLVGGSLMREDAQNIQYEACADWNEGQMTLYGAGMDMLDKCNLLKLADMELKADYCGWWFCCLPMATIREKGLPLPIFIHRDDIEYGLRCGGALCLNGLSVWHGAFERRHSGVNEYYDIRNAGILNAIYGSASRAGEFYSYIRKRVLISLLQYKYAYCDMLIRGVRDFLEGPQLIYDSDCQGLHKEISRMDYKPQPVETLKCFKDNPKYAQIYEKRRAAAAKCIGSESALQKYGDTALNAVSAATVGGFFLPKFHRAICVLPSKPWRCYGAKSAVFADEAGNAFECEFSFAEQKRIRNELELLEAPLKAQYLNISARWLAAFDGLCETEFWKRYLSIK